jgi:hypothetical protein
MLSRTSLLALLLVAFGAVACAPPALDPDHASGSSADSTGSKSSKKKSTSKTTAADDDDDDTTADDKGSTTTPSKQATNTGSTTTNTGSTTTTGGTSAPASFAAVYSGLKSSCGSCHLSGAAGAPTFFGDSEATTYDNFLNQNFNTSPSPLVTKGQHSGPALRSDQQSAVEAWVADDPAK